MVEQGDLDTVKPAAVGISLSNLSVLRARQCSLSGCKHRGLLCLLTHKGEASCSSRGAEQGNRVAREHLMNPANMLTVYAVSCGAKTSLILFGFVHPWRSVAVQSSESTDVEQTRGLCRRGREALAPLPRAAGDAPALECPGPGWTGLWATGLVEHVELHDL